MGTGEATRYLGTYGSAGISRAVLMGVIPPDLLQSDGNPLGVPADGPHAIGWTHPYEVNRALLNFLAG